MDAKILLFPVESGYDFNFKINSTCIDAVYYFNCAIFSYDHKEFFTFFATPFDLTNKIKLYLSVRENGRNENNIGIARHVFSSIKINIFLDQSTLKTLLDNLHLKDEIYFTISLSNNNFNDTDSKQNKTNEVVYVTNFEVSKRDICVKKYLSAVFDQVYKENLLKKEKKVIFKDLLKSIMIDNQYFSDKLTDYRLDFDKNNNLINQIYSEMNPYKYMLSEMEGINLYGCNSITKNLPFLISYLEQKGLAPFDLSTVYPSFKILMNDSENDTFYIHKMYGELLDIYKNYNYSGFSKSSQILKLFFYCFIIVNKLDIDINKTPTKHYVDGDKYRNIVSHRSFLEKIIDKCMSRYAYNKIYLLITSVYLCITNETSSKDSLINLCNSIQQLGYTHITIAQSILCCLNKDVTIKLYRVNIGNNELIVDSQFIRTIINLYYKGYFHKFFDPNTSSSSKNDIFKKITVSPQYKFPEFIDQIIHYSNKKSNHWIRIKNSINPNPPNIK